jgi:hypothetical protein
VNGLLLYYLYSIASEIYHLTMMALTVASTDPSMTLSRREELQKLRISFRILLYKIVFTPRLEDIISKQVCC